jgi:hypothetical protein
VSDVVEPRNNGKPRKLAYTMTHAAEALDVSPDFFAKHIQPELKIVYKGRKRLVSEAEISRWLERSALR